MSGTHTSTLRLTGTQLAQFFRFRCDRQLRYELVPLRARGGDVPAPNADPAAGPVVGPRPGMELLARAGRRFERGRLDALARRFGAEAVLSARKDARGDALRLPAKEVVDTLRDPGAVRFLVQPTLRLRDPAAFARRHGLDPELLEIAPASPDLVRIRRGRGGRLRFEVIDVKWSRERAVHHFAQIAFYVLLLEEIVREEGIAGTVETRWGWVWQRGGGGPKRFPLAAYLHHVEQFLSADLPRVLAAEPAAADWHLGPRCAGCAFFQLCRAEADGADDLARVPGVTPLARRVLRGRGFRTVADLQKAGYRKDTYTGCHALESAETSLKQRAQALRFNKLFEVEQHTHLLSGAESVRVLVSAEADPVSGVVFALGLRVEGGGRGKDDVFLAERGTAAAEGEMLRAFLARLGERVMAAAAGADPAEGQLARSLHFYLWDRGELATIRELLQRHVSDPAAQPAIARLQRLLFRPGDRGRRAPAPGTVLHDAVAELFALPVPYALDLASVSAALKPSERAAVHRPRDDYGWPFSSQVAFERIHNVWRRRPHRTRAGVESPGEVADEIAATVRSKLAALDSVLRAVREQVARGRKPRLRLEPAGAPASLEAETIADPRLETLRIFTEMEAAEEAVAIRALHALPARDRAKRFECVRGMEFVGETGRGHLVFEFDPDCREVKFRPGDFALVLTNDDGETLLETDRKPWLRRQLMVELVDFDLAASPPRVILAPGSAFKDALEKGTISLRHQCVLDRSDADFNTKRVVTTLRRLAEGDGEAVFVRGLLDGGVPEGWLRPLDAAAGWEETVARAGRPVLNREQEEAWRAAFERAVTVVWGPPGTGKTYLLAWTLLGLAAAAKREGRPFRVLVTAVTHRAIVNVLSRLAREVEASGIPAPLRAVKLRGRGAAADVELAGGMVEVIDDEALPARLEAADAEGMPLLVGSTVWSLWKRMRAANGGDDTKPVHPLFDVVVIDEASQMKVAESLVALSSARRGARVIVAGDDRQLAPIVRGSYPDDDALFGSAFTYLSERFGRLMLRESRRMSEGLIDYPRRLFYPGLVAWEPERELRTLPDVDLSDPLDALLWDVCFRPGHAAVLVTYDGYHATARNPLEAHLAARLASLARAGLADPETGERYDAEGFRARALAILSPHRAQNSAILGELAARGWPRDEMPVVDTVERMQGNEREMIVVSYAVADREYAEREAEFLLDPHRFNVSITRARSRLVVFVSEEILRALPREERVMTASMAVKGYPRALSAEVRDVDVTAPDGTLVRLRCRFAATTGSAVPPGAARPRKVFDGVDE